MATATKKAARKKAPAKKAPAKTPVAPELARMIPVDRIEVDPANRDVGDIAELTSSVAQYGILQPLLVTGGELADEYLLVAGARRLAAAKAAGLAEVPCVSRDDLTEGERGVLRLIENLERRDLTPVEEATAYRTLIEQGYTQAELAGRLSRSQGHVSKRLALLDLPDKAQARVDAGQLLIADALDLAKLDDEAQARVLAVGEPEAMRRRIELERARADDEAQVADRMAELGKAGVEARRSADGAHSSWRMIDNRQTVIDEHVEAGIAGAVVWADGLVQWFCTDTDHDHTPEGVRPNQLDGYTPEPVGFLDDELDDGDTPRPAGGPAATPQRVKPRFEQVRDRLVEIADPRADAIREGLARLTLADEQAAAFVAAQQLDILASYANGYTDDSIESAEETRYACRLLHVDPGEADGQDMTPGLHARLLDGRVNPLWILLALTLGVIEEHLTPGRWIAHVFDWTSGAAGAAIKRHYGFLTGHLGYQPDPLEEALLEGVDVDELDPKACGLTNDAAEATA